MKKLLFGCAFASTMLCSCTNTTEDELIGKWSPIEMNRQEIEISAAGGRDSVWTTNYSSIWLRSGRDSNQPVETSVRGQYPTEDNDIREKGYQYLLEDKWITAYVPTNNKKTIVVDVAPNKTGYARSYVIETECGDAFSSITISQKAE